MTDKNAKDALLVLGYRKAAASRRAARKAQSQGENVSTEAIGKTSVGPKVVVRFGRNAKSMSELGGVSKVLGPSRIRIPEYKLPRG